MKSAFIFAMYLFVLLSLVGCKSPSGMAIPAEPVLTSTPASLDFILVTTTSPLPGLDAEKSWLNDRIISSLRESGLFPNVSDNKSDNPAGGGIKVEADIKEINKVSDDARTWFGGLAGEAQVEVQVNVFDATSGRQIETFEAFGNSGKSARAGTTKAAVQRAAEQAAAEIVQLNARTAQ